MLRVTAVGARSGNLMRNFPARAFVPWSVPSPHAGFDQLTAIMVSVANNSRPTNLFGQVSQSAVQRTLLVGEHRDHVIAHALKQRTYRFTQECPAQRELQAEALDAKPKRERPCRPTAKILAVYSDVVYVLLHMHTAAASRSRRTQRPARGRGDGQQWWHWSETFDTGPYQRGPRRFFLKESTKS